LRARHSVVAGEAISCRYGLRKHKSMRLLRRGAEGATPRNDGLYPFVTDRLLKNVTGQSRGEEGRRNQVSSRNLVSGPPVSDALLKNEEERKKFSRSGKCAKGRDENG
jgi:hypothetical protein